MTEFAKELWVIEEIIVHHSFTSDENLGQHRVGTRLNLVCYNKNTKELLHTYGPFDGGEEVLQWAKEHGIKLDCLPSCQHGLWLTSKQQEVIDKETAGFMGSFRALLRDLFK